MSKIEILTIGDELLRGDVVDTNATWLASQFNLLGLTVSRITTAGDQQEEIKEAFREAISRSELLIATGGLGPTEDDRTFSALARATDRDLAFIPEISEHIRLRSERSSVHHTAASESQARIPAGSEYFLNKEGTAPGIRLSVDGRCEVYCLPGVPREMRSLFFDNLLPRIAEKRSVRRKVRRVLKIFGIGEARVQELLEGIETSASSDGVLEVSVHYRPIFPEVHVSLIVDPGASQFEEKARLLADDLCAEAANRLGKNLFAVGEMSFFEALVGRLKACRSTLALAESCTGGLAANMITDVPGSSEVFKLGIVAYSNRAKRDLLGVSPRIIGENGAVSLECVSEMARQVRSISQSTLALAISGIAGPANPGEKKPVGTVHFALDDGSEQLHLHRVFPYDRRRNKQIAAQVGLWMVWRALERRRR